jgi:hypothetical protein
MARVFVRAAACATLALWAYGAAPATAFPVTLDLASRLASGSAWADDPTGASAPELSIPASNPDPPQANGSLDIDLAGGVWTFSLQANGINHEGLTPRTIHRVVMPLALYSGSASMIVTPLGGGQFHAVQAPGSAFATVELSEVLAFDTGGNFYSAPAQTVTGAVTGFECVVNAFGNGDCALTIGPAGFDVTGFDELFTFQHDFSLLTVPEPHGLVAFAGGALAGLAGARGRRPR